ncbi:YtzI protein [Virgibacillus necropolis]|uniref:YtzI protein n=1 Tax=Virgibacillus necropolis TaxID=163877 RepID=A0A221MHM8_9BACI|nr:YtzI protein [Virgibacillus necropolis]ASN07167.1 YtzI protein [Virgibacillus necropolis]
MTGYIVLGIAIILVVLILTLITINKGYAFKHSIDELPEDKNEKDADHSNENHG